MEYLLICAFFALWFVSYGLGTFKRKPTISTANFFPLMWITIGFIGLFFIGIELYKLGFFLYFEAFCI